MANETINIQNGVSPITIDTEVTEGSMRPVTSDGIYKAIQAGGGGGGLPSVTGADYGKLLVVDGQGSWEALELNLLPRYMRINAIIDGNEHFTTDDQFSVDFIMRAFNGGFAVNLAFELLGEATISFPPLKGIIYWNIDGEAEGGILTTSAIGRISNVHLFQIVISWNGTSNPVNVDIITYDAVSPKIMIPLVITDPLTYSGTTSVTSADLQAYDNNGVSLFFQVSVPGVGVVRFDATEKTGGGSSLAVGGTVFIPGMGLAYIETSGDTFTTTPLVAVSP